MSDIANKSSKAETWREDKNIQLIRAFRQKPVLWDPKHELYYNKAQKPAAWNDIGKAINVSPEKCKFKIINLMSAFRREKAKLIRAMRNGADMELKLKSAWYGFKEMSFLLDKEAERRRQEMGNVVDENSENETTKKLLLQGLEKGNLEFDSNRRNKLTFKRKREERESSEESFLDVKLDSTMSGNIDPSGSQSISCSSADEDSISAIHVTSAHESQQTSNDSNAEEITHFVNFIASKMKKYSKPVKNAVQKEICEIIFRADQNYYETVSSEKFTLLYDDPLEEEDESRNKKIKNSN